MKRIISVFIALAMLISLCGTFAYAGEDFIPIIFVPGYSGTQLFRADTGEQVWGFTIEGAVEQLFADIPETMATLGYMTEGEAYKVGCNVGEAGVAMFEELLCNPDGTPTVELVPHSVDAEHNSYTYLMKNEDGKYIHEIDIQRMIADEFGGDRIFSFQVDFRQGAIGCANDLRAFVQSVKAYTGSSKVRLFGISHGGLVTGTYMSLYGTLGDVTKAVMTVPALGGTDIAVNALKAESKLNEHELLNFLEAALGTESDLARIFETTRIDILDALLEGFFTGLHPLFEYWGSIWDFIPADVYDELKAQYLNSEDSAALIAKSDDMHYNIMTSYNDKFTLAQSSGADVFIHCSTGSQLAFGGEDNSDIIINTSLVSGAKCAPLGQRFADGYKHTGTNCTNPAHNHVSPSMEVDASYAYLPEHTWFTDGQFHGMYVFDPYSAGLTWELLMTDNIRDIYTDPAYPQFEVSHNTHEGIHAKLDVSPTGFISGSDGAIVITNLSDSYPVKITSMYFDGLDLDIDSDSLGTQIPVGGKLTIPFTGTVPDVSAVRTALYVDYLQLGAIPAARESVFDITINNGDAPAYNTDEPFCEADSVDSLTNHIPSDLYDIFTAVGIKTDLVVLFNMLSRIFELVESITGRFS